nr:hypothetical protein BaRGS_013897 [Batillaria attramentaria]
MNPDTKKNKNWMMNQSNTITTFDVDGGKIYARYGACTRPRGYQWRRQSGRADCMESNFTRVCLARRGDSKYIVRHIESTYGDKFVCMEFLQRGISVVQVKMSLILGESYVQRLCDPDYNFVDPWPWISEEHYRSPAVDCPFSAGLNLHLKYSNPPPAGRMSYDYYGVLSAYSNYGETDPHACADSTTASSRIESDCVPREGVVFNFKHESCLPAGSRLALKQRALCMATWRQEGEDFAMLRADNNDRNFFCLRVSYDNTTHEVSEVALFEAWVCPTSSAQRLAPQHDAHYSLMVFEALSKQVVTEPCSDQLRTCHKHSSFCRGLQCMRTCGKCFPSRDSVARREGTAADTGSSGSNRVAKKATLDTRNRFAAQNSRDSVRDRPHQTPGGFSGDGGGYVEHNDKDNNPARLEGESTEQLAYRQPCTFPESMRGAWLQRTVDGTDERLVITESTLHHPSLGALDCITFSPPGSEAVPLRRVLWGHYDNGCYPRFTCIHYNTPAKSVMRYRLADVQQWPLQLSDDVICDEKNFLEPPDMYQPGDRYTERSWEVVRREGHIHKMACILPHYLPRVVSFMDDRGRSGCFVHGTYYSPRAISLTFFPKEQRRGSNSSPTTKGDKFVGADNDETENPDEILCWLVVDEYTVVILKTSSCNSQTAQRVLDDHARNSKYGQHLYRILNLHQGEKDCDAMFPAEKIWPEPVPILVIEGIN